MAERDELKSMLATAPAAAVEEEEEVGRQDGEGCVSASNLEGKSFVATSSECACRPCGVY